MATNNLELETPAALQWLTQINQACSSDQAFSMKLAVYRAPVHYSDELNPDPAAIHYWEKQALMDLCSARRRVLQREEMWEPIPPCADCGHVDCRCWGAMAGTENRNR